MIKRFAYEFCKLSVIVLFAATIFLIALGTTIIAFQNAFLKITLYASGVVLLVCGVIAFILTAYLLIHAVKYLKDK